MKKVNWKLIAIVIGAIGWLTTALYALEERRKHKYWENQWEKELNKSLDYKVLARAFKEAWVLYKSFFSEYAKTYYSDELNRYVAEYEKLEKSKK